jgi:site-specific recombinase XerD
MQLLQSGVELSTIQSWLGHASINTTHQYVEADLEMKRRALEKCNNSEASPTPYQPTDEVLAFLESL